MMTITKIPITKNRSDNNDYNDDDHNQKQG